MTTRELAKKKKCSLGYKNINTSVYRRLTLVYQARGEASTKALLASPLGQQPQGSQYALGRAAARAAGRERQSLCFYQLSRPKRRRHEAFRAATAAAAARRWVTKFWCHQFGKKFNSQYLFIYLRDMWGNGIWSACVCTWHPLNFWPLRVCDCFTVIAFCATTTR